METPVINTRVKLYGHINVSFSWLEGCDKVTVKYFKDGIELHENNYKYYKDITDVLVKDFFLANPKLTKWSY